MPFLLRPLPNPSKQRHFRALRAVTAARIAGSVFICGSSSTPSRPLRAVAPSRLPSNARHDETNPPPPPPSSILHSPSSLLRASVPLWLHSSSSCRLVQIRGHNPIYETNPTLQPTPTARRANTRFAPTCPVLRDATPGRGCCGGRRRFARWRGRGVCSFRCRCGC